MKSVDFPVLINIEAVAGDDSVTLDTKSLCVFEDGCLTPVIDFIIGDPMDADEMHTLTINIPMGWSVVEGSENGWTDNGDGTYFLKLINPPDKDENFDMIKGEGSVEGPKLAPPPDSDEDASGDKDTELECVITTEKLMGATVSALDADGNGATVFSDASKGFGVEDGRFDEVDYFDNNIEKSETLIFDLGAVAESAEIDFTFFFSPEGREQSESGHWQAYRNGILVGEADFVATMANGIGSTTINASDITGLGFDELRFTALDTAPRPNTNNNFTDNSDFYVKQITYQKVPSPEKLTVTLESMDPNECDDCEGLRDEHTKTVMDMQKIVVDAVADPVEIKSITADAPIQDFPESGGEHLCFYEDTPIVLTITGEVGDVLDGSEMHTLIVLLPEDWPTPDGWEVSSVGDGVISYQMKLGPEDFMQPLIEGSDGQIRAMFSKDVTLAPPKDFSGKLDVKFTLEAMETPTDMEKDTKDNLKSTMKTISLNIEAVAGDENQVEILGQPLEVVEDNCITPQIKVTIGDAMDPDEVHTLTLTIPTGWTVVMDNGWILNNIDGTYSKVLVSGDFNVNTGMGTIDGPKLQPPANDDTDADGTGEETLSCKVNVAYQVGVTIIALDIDGTPATVFDGQDPDGAAVFGVEENRFPEVDYMDSMESSETLIFEFDNVVVSAEIDFTFFFSPEPGGPSDAIEEGHWEAFLNGAKVGEEDFVATQKDGLHTESILSSDILGQGFDELRFTALDTANRRDGKDNSDFYIEEIRYEKLPSPEKLMVTLVSEDPIDCNCDGLTDRNISEPVSDMAPIIVDAEVGQPCIINVTAMICEIDNGNGENGDYEKNGDYEENGDNGDNGIKVKPVVEFLIGDPTDENEEHVLTLDTNMLLEGWEVCEDQLNGWVDIGEGLFQLTLTREDFDNEMGLGMVDGPKLKPPMNMLTVDADDLDSKLQQLTVNLTGVTITAKDEGGVAANVKNTGNGLGVKSVPDNSDGNQLDGDSVTNSECLIFTYDDTYGSFEFDVVGLKKMQGTTSPETLRWEAFLGAVLVGSGSFVGTMQSGTDTFMVDESDLSGPFDTIKFSAGVGGKLSDYFISRVKVNGEMFEEGDMIEGLKVSLTSTDPAIDDEGTEPNAPNVLTANYIAGTNEPDVIDGTDDKDTIDGKEGNDCITAGLGADIILLDPGKSDEDLDTIKYTNVNEGLDTVHDFDVVGILHDTIDFDALFDDLGFEEAGRESRVIITDMGGDALITVDQSAAGDGSDTVDMVKLVSTDHTDVEIGEDIVVL